MSRADMAGLDQKYFGAVPSLQQLSLNKFVKTPIQEIRNLTTIQINLKTLLMALPAVIKTIREDGEVNPRNGGGPTLMDTVLENLEEICKRYPVSVAETFIKAFERGPKQVVYRFVEITGSLAVPIELPGMSNHAMLFAAAEGVVIDPDDEPEVELPKRDHVITALAGALLDGDPYESRAANLKAAIAPITLIAMHTPFTIGTREVVFSDAIQRRRLPWELYLKCAFRDLRGIKTVNPTNNILVDLVKNMGHNWYHNLTPEQVKLVYVVMFAIIGNDLGVGAEELMSRINEIEVPSEDDYNRKLEEFDSKPRYIQTFKEVQLHSAIVRPSTDFLKAGIGIQ